MSWNAKVHWTEGLFLRPHHLQQGDRYLENAIESRTRHVTPYPWGFSMLEIDRDLAQQSKFALRRGAGVMPDGGLFDFPGEVPPPAPIAMPEAAAGQLVWLTMPARADNTREVSAGTGGERGALRRRRRDASSIPPRTCASRRRSRSPIRASPTKSARPPSPATSACRSRASSRCTTARWCSTRSSRRPLLVCAAHPTVEGWLDRVIGWIGNKLDELARYAGDATAGGGLQSADYLMLQMLNRRDPGARALPLLALRPSRAALRGAAAHRRRTRDLRHPGAARARIRAPTTTTISRASSRRVLRDIQDFLSARLDRRAIRLELIERAPNAYISTIKDRTLFRNATFVLEVSARRPLTEIQQQPAGLPQGRPQHQDERDRPRPSAGRAAGASADAAAADPRDHRPRLFLSRPHLAALAGVQRRPRRSAMHFAGDWPELQMELWAVREDRR